MFTEIVGCSEQVTMGIVPATVPATSVQLLYVTPSIDTIHVDIEVEG